MENRFTKKTEERVFKNILNKKLLEKGDNIIVSVSGGPDSTFLIHILDLFNKKYKYNIKFNIMHLNHLLREEAGRDEDFVRKLAEKYNAEFFSKKVDIEKKAKDEKTSIELAGRNARNEFLKEIEEKIKNKNREKNKENKEKKEEKIKIVYGHHADDVAETFILNVLRGSSLRGMTSIKEKNGNKLRPIIFLKKAEILKYLEIKEIPFVIDETNFETEYMRNKIRNIVIPYFEENINKASAFNIYKASQSANEVMEYIDKETNRLINDLEKNININEFLENILEDEQTKLKINEVKYFEINELKKIDDVILKNIIYKKIENIKFNKGIIEDILSIIKNNYGNKYINISGKKIFFIKKSRIYILDLKD